jgi:hypothetical protein
MPYETIQYPWSGSIVYYLSFQRPGDTSETPFYVGESGRHVGRLGDYIAANFAALVDFKVGVAARFLQRRGLIVLFRYQQVPENERMNVQASLIQSLARDYLLLNNKLPQAELGNNPETARGMIENFVQQHILSQ